jgi:hypothetical protein
MENAISSSAQQMARRQMGAQGFANKGIRDLGKWVNPGVQANNAQAALSGAMGPEAQAQAYAQFQESPGQAFLREQGERALLRNQAAIGGLGGGNVMKELTKYGQGLAAQDFDNYYNRMGTVADRGMQAQGLRSGLYGKKADAAISAANNAAQIQAASIGAGGSVAGSQIAGETALMRDAGRYAYDTGLNLANNVNNTSSALASLINQQGSGMSDIYGNTTSNLANLLVSGGRDASTGASNLASLLAGTRTGSAQQVAGLPGIPGTQDRPGLLQNIGNAIGGATQGVQGAKTMGWI